MTWLVVRVRSDVGVERTIKQTMHMLNLTRVNHAVLVPENDKYKGMLQKAKDYITWGEVSEATINNLISERGRLAGDKRIDDAVVKDNSEFKDVAGLSKAIAAGDATVKDVAGMKRVFRLHPPRGAKGWGGIKRSFRVGGALGARGDEIDALVAKMM